MQQLTLADSIFGSRKKLRNCSARITSRWDLVQRQLLTCSSSRQRKAPATLAEELTSVLKPPKSSANG